MFVYSKPFQSTPDSGEQSWLNIIITFCTTWSTQMFAGNVGAYLSEDKAPGLTHKHQARLEKLDSDKHSGILRKLVNYSRKTFITLGPWTGYSLTF